MIPRIITVFTLILYLNFSNFSLNRIICFLPGLIRDEFSLFIVYLTCFVLYISFIVRFNFLSTSLTITLTIILLVCVLLFSTRNMFIFYILYEMSLIPILFIIITWGRYPERRVRSIILLLYTSFFTLPFLYVLFVLYGSLNSRSFIINFHGSSFITHTILLRLVTFITFAVKLPVYGLHFWLPIAHVEAPTFGSMILAGVLLKLGGIGLIRFFPYICFIKLNFLFRYFLLSLVYVTILCCIQSDFKRLVAYSSISHIITVPLMIFSSYLSSLKGVLLVIILHGISSPLMFMLVGIVYSINSTRQHLILRGIILSNPLLRLIVVLSFFFSLSAPPYPSYVREVLFSVSTISFWSGSFVFILMFIFFSMVYNLLWIRSILFLNQSFNFNYIYSLNYLLFLPLILSSLFLPLIFSVLFYYI